jgi:hypothetical protein
MVISWRIFLFSLLILTLWVSTASALTMQAVADRDRIAVGESLQLQLRIDGSPDNDPELAPLQQNWDILSRSQSSQMQIINGSFSRSVVYTLTLMPRAQGTQMIPAICAEDACSQPIAIEVSESSTRNGETDQPLLLETEVSSQKVMPYEQLLLTVRLLRRVDLLEGQLSEPQPVGVEAVVKKLGDDRSYETRRNGLLYQVIERNYAIFPQNSGDLKIPALQFDGSITSGRARFDLYGRQGRRVRRNSQPLQIEVAALPSDLGRRPWIPASALELEDDWQRQPPQLVVGEPATRTLRLSVRGVTAARLPELNPVIPESFKSYLDQPSREDNLDSSGVTGILEQKTALVPTRPGRFQLPAIDLDWWDVTSGRWQQAHLDALDVEVSPADDDSPAVSSPASPQPEPSTTPRSVEQAGSKTPVSTGPSIVNNNESSSGFWPWLSLGLALAWLLTLVALLRQRRQPATVKAVEEKPVRPDEKAARQAVIQAARQHNPQMARQALVVWSRILWPDMPGGEYEYLCKTSDPVLREQLNVLDRSLYGEKGQPWDGQPLADCVAACRQDLTAKKTSELPELYPDDHIDRI